ncbi:YqcC family protein [Pseudoalteromonas sp. MMG005]|uniref:YqcC family protein n=1 Tax=Pseudoalteromonas sp. MMG005 TaxID=2822682 RepID=UPI001B39F009|nr:YqcC family protein [Pseudoalteromonas sp. MMG005]MBQ4848148.1 YqcC family protein [Pseudoalteromonas sp. MMG005]
MAKKNQVDALLTQLTQELTQAELWQYTPIEPRKLLSSEPFCCDTLQFEQWLQFIFIPKIRQLIVTGAPLPNNISIAPMAEIHYSKLACFLPLHRVLSELDAILSGR